MNKLDDSSHKREHDENDGGQNKRKKHETPEDPVALTNFIDVNDYCLMHIFQYLMLRDLMNVADTCKRFQPSAESVFASKCRGKILKLLPGRHLVKFQRIKLIGNIIRISNIQSCLKILRLFGSSISKLHIDYHSYRRITQNQRNALARYMNEFCSDSLIDIEMDSASNDVTANWIKPFKNTETIGLRFCIFDDMNTWFPKMQRLVIHRSFDMIEKSFPHLKVLEIHIYEEDCFPKIHFNSVNEFCVNLLDNDMIPKIPFTFDQLKKVEVKAERFYLNENFKLLIRENPSITKLEVYIENIRNPQPIDEVKMNLVTEFNGLNITVEQSQYDVTPAQVDI